MTLTDPNAPAPQPGQPAPAVQPAAPATAASQEPARTSVADLPPAALNARLRAAERQAREKLLADLGGDPADVKAELERLRAIEAERAKSAEEAKRAQMSEVDRLKAEIADRDATIADLRRQLGERDSAVQSAKADLIVRETIGEHIDPTMQEDAREALRRHVRGLPADQRRKFGAAEASAFFADLAKKKPRYAKESGTPAKVEKQPPARRPLANGAPPKTVVPATPIKPANGGKKAKDMSRAELDAAWGKFRPVPAAR